MGPYRSPADRPMSLRHDQSPPRRVITWKMRASIHAIVTVLVMYAAAYAGDHHILEGGAVNRVTWLLVMVAGIMNAAYTVYFFCVRPR
jgi:hypothetical protein